FILSRPCSLLLRLARAISTTRNFTLPVRLRNFVPTAPVISLILFISRVSTRTPSPIQTAIGRIVNVGLHHGGVHSQFAARDDLFGLCDGHQPLMQLLHRLRPQLPRQTSHRLIVEIGRASCRERVESAVVAGTRKEEMGIT